MKPLTILFLFSLNAHAAGKIINADIAPAGTANIARNKMASGTNYAWCVNSSSGVMSDVAVTASRAVATDANGSPVASATTATELGYVSGVTSSIQTQLNAKQATISIGAFSAAPSAPGLTLSGAAINMDPADATHPGGVSTTTQTLAGAKTFSSAPTFSTMTLGSILLAGTGGLLSQDNANFFWDATNHRLGLGTTSPNSLIDIKSSSNDNAHGIRFSPASGAEYYTLFMSSASALTLTNPNQGVTLWQVNNQGRTVFAGAGFGHPDAEVLFQNGSGHTGIPSIAIKKLTSQTADFATFYDTDEVTKLFTVTIAGKAVASNIQDTAFSSAGVVTNDASGNLASVVPGTSGNVLTSNGSAWVSQAAGGGGCVAPVLTKTSGYTILTSDFTCANKVMNVEANCSADCAITFPAASNSGYEVRLINIGTATATATLAGSDTFGSTADQTWILPAGGSPQSSNTFWANGGSRWNGM